MSAALGLLRMQRVDSRIGQLDTRLKQIRTALESDAELAAARQELEHAATDLDEAESAHKTAEVQRQAQRSKMQQAESSLYSGTVQHPKELQDLQADVASLRKHLAKLEDLELDCMVRLEAAQQVLVDARRRLDEVTARVASEQQRLVDEESRLNRDRESLQAERQAAESTISIDLVESYEALRQSRHGLAVVEIAENACAACGTVLTAALQQNARHALELVHCPSCGRILFAG
jgi:predicted  nucleic acid-binding Zn-ribbon protein